jgi:hypothetical protein
MVDAWVSAVLARAGDDLLSLVRPIFLFLILSVVTIWIAVGWHRAILLNEAPAMLWPRWHGAANRQYFKSALIYFIVLFAIVLPAVFILHSIFPVFDAQVRRPSVQTPSSRASLRTLFCCILLAASARSCRLPGLVNA